MPNRFPPRTRKTVPLHGTVKQVHYQLSFQAAAAARLAALMLSRAGEQVPPPSAIVRQALLDYAQRLERLGPGDRAWEAKRVKWAANARTPLREEQWPVDEALEAAEASPDAPLPSFATVTLADPSIDLAALEARLEAHPGRWPQEYPA